MKVENLTCILLEWTWYMPPRALTPPPPHTHIHTHTFSDADQIVGSLHQTSSARGCLKGKDMNPPPPECDVVTYTAVSSVESALTYAKSHSL